MPAGLFSSVFSLPSVTRGSRRALFHTGAAVTAAAVIVLSAGYAGAEERLGQQRYQDIYCPGIGQLTTADAAESRIGECVKNICEQVFKKERDTGKVKNWWAKKTDDNNDTMVVGVCEEGKKKKIEFRMLLADTGMPETLIRTRGAKYDPEAEAPENAYDLAAPPPGAGGIPALPDYAAMRAEAAKAHKESDKKTDGGK